MAASISKRQMRHGASARRSPERRSVRVSPCISPSATSPRRSSTTKAGKTLASVNTTENELRADKKTRANVATAAKVGKLVAERGTAKKVNKVVFDRGGFIYHGKVKALADAAREGGLEF